MAKVSFTKLGLSKNQDVKVVEFNGQGIEIKQYLPVNDKLQLISDVINASADDNNFANPVKVSVFTTLMILENYTNINFTDKQKEDPSKLYDLVVSGGLVKEVINAIPEEEYNEILCGIADSIEAVYTYRNSAMGILDTISADYSALQFDAENIHSQIADPENITLLKSIVTKFG